MVFDPTSFPKKGTHSVGVKRQWCGRLGKRETARSASPWHTPRARRAVPFVRVDEWVKELPLSRWKRFTVRPGSQTPTGRTPRR
ncbi:MAG: transposase [Planctomycetota bacterium]